LPTGDTTPELILAQTLFDQLPFEQTTNGGGGGGAPPGGGFPYVNTLTLANPGDILDGTMEVTLNANFTWSATFSGTNMDPVLAPWSMEFNAPGPNDEIFLNTGGPGYSGTDVSSTANVGPGSTIRGASGGDKYLDGTATVDFKTGDTYENGIVNGTWIY
jgi:hypothetical protein